ncbi:MAG: hypothetical protein DRJ01_13790 [Bacteroidetes bacterium]|nr:MAG: hypothetical protein DRJ01_13790 [Bacteroidota bacterium]
MDTRILLEDFDVVLDLDEDGVYVPINYKTEDGEWCIIEDDIISDWIIYIKMALSSPDKISKKKKVGNLYSYQWGFSVRAILKIMNFKAETIDVEWSRQLIYWLSINLFNLVQKQVIA